MNRLRRRYHEYMERHPLPSARPEIARQYMLVGVMAGLAALALAVARQGGPGGLGAVALGCLVAGFWLLRGARRGGRGRRQSG